MTFLEMHVKWSVTLTDRLGPEILAVLEIKGQVLHRVRLHVKVPRWLVGWVSLHHGSTGSRKNLEQKFIFQLGTLSPHGINEHLSFH